MLVIIMKSEISTRLNQNSYKERNNLILSETWVTYTYYGKNSKRNVRRKTIVPNKILPMKKGKIGYPHKSYFL